MLYYKQAVDDADKKQTGITTEVRLMVSDMNVERKQMGFEKNLKKVVDRKVAT